MPDVCTRAVDLAGPDGVSMTSLGNCTRMCQAEWARNFDVWSREVERSFSDVFLLLHSVYGGEESLLGMG